MKRAADGNGFNQMMKIPALGTGVTPSSPSNSSNDQSSQMQQLLIQNILQQQAAQGSNGSNDTNMHAMSLINNPIYQQLLFGNNSMQNLQAQLVQTLSKQYENNQAQNNHNNGATSNVDLQPNQLLNGGQQNNEDKSLLKIKESPTTTINYANCAIFLSSDFKLYSSKEANTQEFSSITSLILHLMKCSESELLSVCKANDIVIGETGPSKEVILEMIADHAMKKTSPSSTVSKEDSFNSAKDSAISDNEEIDKVRKFLSQKGLENYASTFVLEGFTLQTFLEMSEQDANDASELAGLKAGEKMRLKQLIRKASSYKIDGEKVPESPRSEEEEKSETRSDLGDKSE